MKEIEKKAAKSIKDKILGWMKGNQPETEIVQRPTAVGKQYDSNVREREARYQTPSGKTGTNEPYFEGYSPRQAESGWQGVTDPNNSRKVFKTSKDNTPSADMGRRLKQESDDFYNSDAGKGVRKPLSSFKDFSESEAQKFHHTKMAKSGNADKIGDHVANKDEYVKMGQSFNAKDYFKKQNMKDSIKSVSGSGLTDIEKVALGGMAGATGGEIISAGMDLNQAVKRRDAEAQKNQSQADAHSYWSRKKSGQ